MVGGLREQQHLLGDGISIPCCRQVSEDLTGFPFCTYDKQTIECHMTPPLLLLLQCFGFFLTPKKEMAAWSFVCLQMLVHRGLKLTLGRAPSVLGSL